MQTVTVEVTQHHIRTGNPTEPTSCPVAKAIRKATGIKLVEVSSGDVQLNDGDKRFKLPKRVTNFISKFDCEGPSAVKPFSFRFRYSK